MIIEKLIEKFGGETVEKWIDRFVNVLAIVLLIALITFLLCAFVYGLAWYIRILIAL